VAGEKKIGIAGQMTRSPLIAIALALLSQMARADEVPDKKN
jgi:hypothetical protein